MASALLRLGKLLPQPGDLSAQLGDLVGPRLSALVAYLKGVCHCSFSTIRKFLRDVACVTISRGQLAKLIAKVSEPIGRATNNVAEYSGLLAGLRAAAKLAPGADTEVRMDSRLAVEQMSGRWKIKHPDLRSLASQASQAARGLGRVTYTWVPRERNSDADRLANAPSADECRRILASSLRAPADPPNGVQRAIEAVASSHGDIDLEWVARQAGMSERQFRRRCLEESGLPPKQLCRVLRFRRACTLGERGLPWGLIAAEAGYFDQAHLIRDFREFTGGNTPVSVFSNTRDGHSG